MTTLERLPQNIKKYNNFYELIERPQAALVPVRGTGEA